MRVVIRREGDAEGRYHSTEFGDVAEKLGLETDWYPGVGFTPKMVDASGGYKIEAMSPEGLRRFAPEIRAIDYAMAASVPSETESMTPLRRSDRAPVAMACQCTTPKRLIRASVGVALAEDIVCAKCVHPFRLVPGQRISEANLK